MFYEQVKLYEERDDVTLTSYVLDDSVEMLNGGKNGRLFSGTDQGCRKIDALYPRACGSMAY